MAGFFYPHSAKKKMNAVKTQLNTSTRMRDARHQLRITQFELAQRAGCSESQITKIETGRAVPDASLKQRIAAILEKPTFELFEC